MSIESKFLNLKHAIKYRSFQPFKFFILKKRFKKNKDITLSLLEEDSSVIKINSTVLQDKFMKEYSEFKIINDKTKNRFKTISEKFQITLHGVHYPDLLYIILKLIQPLNVLETGVWLGLSTNTILASGLKYNKKFTLDSVDLPRGDIKNPESFIGLLVDKKFKKNWNLHLGKDRKVTKSLIKKNKYNFYYFDSDKSLGGKLFLLNQVLKNTKDYFIMFDDLEDNLFWYRNELKQLEKIVIKYGNKYIGLIYSKKYDSIIRELYV